MGSSLLDMALKMTSGTTTIFFMWEDQITIPAVRRRGAELAGIDCVLFME